MRCGSDMHVTNNACEFVKKAKDFVMLNEENIQPQACMAGSGHSADAWWLDSGASNHMTGSGANSKS